LNNIHQYPVGADRRVRPPFNTTTYSGWHTGQPLHKPSKHSKKSGEKTHNFPPHFLIFNII
ncbi:hypothetical protein ACLSYV_10500, partial [Avibacterium avium]|uniref:hypothetical protein n=1 Tax=Avibacterium avium TaxID=751 RepID=UPI003BF7E826